MRLNSAVIAGWIFVLPFTAAAQWPVNGLPLGLTTAQMTPLVLPDDNHGAMLGLSLGEVDSSRVFAVQRVDANGAKLWGPVGTVVGTGNAGLGSVLASDGAGGVLVVFGTTDIRVQRIDGSGAILWPSGGTVIATGLVGTPRIVGDGAGGAYCAWVQWVNESDPAPGILAQHLDASGTLLWNPPLELTPSSDDDLSLGALAGGSAIAVWPNNSDVYAQRLAPSGTVWTPGGVLVCGAAGIQEFATAVSDMAGGAILAWRDDRGPIHAQRLDAAGIPQWTVNGIAIGSETDDFVNMVSDGSGGCILAASPGLRAQRLNATGTLIWGTQPVRLSSDLDAATPPTISSDGDHGLLATWSYPTGALPTYQVRAQRVAAAGSVIWDPAGVQVCQLPSDQFDPAVTPDASGGAIVAWLDTREPAAFGIYAMRVHASGTPAAYGEPGEPASFAGTVFPNPVRFLASIGFHLAVAGDVDVRLLDVTGRRVRGFTFPRAAAGSRRLDFDTRDASGLPLPAGVYVVQVRVNGTQWSRKMVVRH